MASEENKNVEKWEKHVAVAQEHYDRDLETDDRMLALSQRMLNLALSGLRNARLLNDAEAGLERLSDKRRRKCEEQEQDAIDNNFITTEERED